MSNQDLEVRFAVRDREAGIEEVPGIADVLIVGAGPAGLAAAIAASRAGLDYRLLEKGMLVNSIFNFPRNMVFFTTAELLEIGGLPFTTPFDKPTRAEALRYYRRVADTFGLSIAFEENVRSIEWQEPFFRVTTRLSNGKRRFHHSRALVAATGYYDHPNLLGVPGEGLPHVSHYYSESHKFYRKKVVVVGGRNSASEAALDLFRSGAQVTLVHRGTRLGESIKYWVLPDIQNRIREGAIAARFNSKIAEIRSDTVVLESSGQREELPADRVLLLTGYHPDAELLRRAGVRVQDDTFVPEHNPETFETNVPGLYLAGAVVSGRETNRIFIENGRFHGATVIKAICERLARCGRVGGERLD